MKIAWMLSGMMAFGQIVNPTTGGGGGGNPSVGTAGQIQKAGSTTGTFAASSLTDNGTQVTAGEPISITGAYPALVPGSITPDYVSGSLMGRIVATSGTGSIPAIAFLGLNNTGSGSVTYLTLYPTGAASFLNAVATPRVTAPAINSGVSANTDLNGLLTLSGGTASYTFAATYTSAPTCVASDDTAVAAVRVTVTTTTLTVTGTGTDTASYICIGRN